MAVRGETSWRPRRQCPPLWHQRPACVSGSPESEARGLRGQGGRIQRGQSSTQTTRGPGPRRGFIQHHFVSIQTVQKEVTSLWGRGAGNSGRRCSGAQPPSQVGGPGCRRQGQVAPRMVQCVARGRDLPLRRCRELSVRVLPRVPRPGQCKGKPLRPTHSLLPQPALRSRHPGQSPGQSRPTTATKQGKKGQSLRGTAVHHGWHGRTRTHPGVVGRPPSDRCRKGQRDRSRASSPIQMKALGTRSSF